MYIGLKYLVDETRPVTITLDLRGLKEISTVTVSFGSIYPRGFVLERTMNTPSPNATTTWEPWQYFSESCSQVFGLIADGVPTTTDDAVCTSIRQQAGLDSVSRVLSFSTLAPNRPPLPASRDYRTDLRLQRFTQARGIRLRFVQYTDIGTGYDYFGAPFRLLNFPFYIVEDISVTGRCMCNGHASSCDANGDCSCVHNTTGAACTECMYRKLMLARVAWHLCSVFCDS